MPRRKRSAPGRKRKSRIAAKRDTRRRWPYAAAALSLLLVVVIWVLVERSRSGSVERSRSGSVERGRSGSGSSSAIRSTPPEIGREVPQIANLDALDPGMAGAVREAVASVRRDPGDAAAYGHLGLVYHAHDYVELARQCYERAHRLAPQVADWPYYLGFFAAGRGETQEAIRYFEKVIELRSDYLPAYFRLGNVLLAEGRLDEAQAAYRTMVTKAPREPWAYVGLGKAAGRQDRFEEAANQLRKALNLDPENRETLYLLAMAHAELGQEERASELLRGIEGSEVSPIADPMLERALRQTRDLQAQIAVANGLVAEKRYSAAEAIYRRVLDLDPELFDVHLDLGVLFGLTGRNEEAERMLTRAVALEPGRADGHTMLAIAYLKTQRPELAFEELQTALELDPNHARAREILTSMGVEHTP